jgi:hypothetical protein
MEASPVRPFSGAGFHRYSLKPDGAGTEHRRHAAASSTGNQEAAMPDEQTADQNYGSLDGHPAKNREAQTGERLGERGNRLGS